ncbi:hypothetical protein [Paracoccus sp. (in: a-proteobacteria)]|uniref:hypothetical protein n=1 Tax=Paracoccus sp. TaxID=267 RepID=UPI002B00026C|nr:hypothetical protein [Paracoccus sp. (in: a-proteobacteria)]
MDELLTTIVAFAVTGVISAPYIIGFRDPEDFNPIGTVWMVVGFAIWILTASFGLGVQAGRHFTWMEILEALPAGTNLPVVDSSKISEFSSMIGWIGFAQTAALFIFQTLYIDPKLRKIRQNKAGPQ